MKYEIYISYSRKDGEAVRRICELLDEAGVSYYINPEGNDEDKDFSEEQIAKIKSCEKMLFVASFHAYKSALALREIYHGFSNLKKSNVFLYQIDNHPLPKSINAIFLAENCRNIVDNPFDASLICDMFRIIPQPVVAEVPKPEPQPVVAEVPKPETQPVVAETPKVEPQPVVAEAPKVEPQPVVAEVPKPEPQPAPQPKVAPRPQPAPRPSVVAAKAGRPASLNAMPKKRSKTGLIIGVVVGLIVLATAVLTLIVVGGIDFSRVKEPVVEVVHEDVPGAFDLNKLPVDNKTTYKVGDIYNKNGKAGVVFEVSRDGKHGKIVSFDTTQEQWITADLYAQGVIVGIFNEEDGKINTDAIMARGDSYKFPAAQWCRMKGNDWYLPAISEVETLLLHAHICRAVNNTLRSVGAPELHTYGEKAWYWSSTEYPQSPANFAWLVRSHDAQTNYGYKNHDRNQGDPYVRAVAAF